MALSDVLKAATISDLSMNADLLLLHMYARRNNEVLNFLYDKGIIDDSSIDAALEKAVFRQARQDYRAMTSKGKRGTFLPDHFGMPECLAYALQRGQFSEREVRQIHFDHGDTAETFTKKYGRENLLSTLREKLLNPYPLPVSEGDCGAYIDGKLRGIWGH